MKSPHERYAQDPNYKQLTDALEALIRDARMTPSEIRECALLACIHHELHFGMTFHTVPLPIKEAMEALAKWRKDESNPSEPSG